MQALKSRTKAHYNEYPFIEGGPNRIAWWREYLRDFFPDDLIKDRLILDVGSSVGEITRGLLNSKARMTCIDLSIESLRRCREINEEADILNSDALNLPFPDESFDHAMSIGVLHHTPDCRRGFHELSRVTARGGTIVVFLYNYWNIYNPIYHAFAPVRALLPLDRIPRWMVKTMQPFAKLHLGQTLNDRQLRNLLGDKLWTPQATFHSVSEVRRWGAEEGLRMTGVKKFFLGYANVMCFVKNGEPNSHDRRELTLKCLSCGKTPMNGLDDAYRCGSCAHQYPIDGGITVTLPSGQSPD